MAIKGSLTLDLTVRQRLVLTPQLRQAIRILQLPLVDLRQEIEEQLERNPLLEQEEEEAQALEGEEEGERADPLEPLDVSWQDLYDSLPPPSQEEGDFQQREPEELKHHLLWQLEITTTDPEELEAGQIVIDALDEGGLLTTPLEALAESFPHLSREVWERALTKIQSFDPTGVGARSVEEALSLQLAQLPETPARELAQKLLSLGLEALSRFDRERLKRRLGCSEEQLSEALALLRRLNPRPGSAIGEVKAGYIVPDLFVRFREGRFVVELNEEALPKLRINPLYAQWVSREQAPLRALLQEAKRFLRGIEQRKQTLVRVAEAIVERQERFFREGVAALRPMTIKEIAEAVGLHESTVSRAIAQKYMATPRGLLPFKFFFSSRLASPEGEVSATAVKARIRQLIEAEDPKKPLSDAKLAKLLQKEGIEIARRTVAKYRDELGIPPSSARRRRLS